MDGDMKVIMAALERIEARLEEITRPMPALLTMKRAAAELSIGMTKLKGLVLDGTIGTKMVGRRPMVPASEVYRLAVPSFPKPRRSGGRPKTAPFDGRAEAAKSREWRRLRRIEIHAEAAKVRELARRIRRGET